MNEINYYRITKFNPAFRNKQGRFLRSDWTAWTDALNTEEYLKIENRYCKTVLDCIKLSGVKRLKIDCLEEKYKFIKIFIKTIKCDDWAYIDILIRMLLREQIWFRLSGPNSFYIHVGYDFYMYIGGRFKIKQKKMNNLYIENFKSPYLASDVKKNF